MRMLALFTGLGLFVSLASQAASPLDSLNCKGFSQEKSAEFSLSKFNPPSKTLGGVSFPGHGKTLFRGAYEANPQFDLEKVIRALFREDDWFMGSPMFWGTTQVLMKRKGMNDPFLPSGGLPLRMKDYFEVRKIFREVSALLSCAPQDGYSEITASYLAADLMNKVFSRMSSDRLQNTYFNMANPEYYDDAFEQKGFGNNAVDFVIASTYDQIAALYGKKVLVLADKRRRGLDLGFWNYAHIGRFWDGWVDQGEINIPGYIKADEVLGLQIRVADRARTNWGRALPNVGIEYAIYPHEQEGRQFVLLLDGDKELCHLKGWDNRFYSCLPNWHGLMEDVTPYPTIGSMDAKYRVPLIGVFMLCDSDQDGDCKVPQSLWDWYGVDWKTRPIPSEVQKITSTMKVNGKQVVYHAAPVSRSGIQVISATYAPVGKATAVSDADVTGKSRSFLNGKSKETYKVSSRFLGVQLKEPREFVLKWVCDGQTKKVFNLKIDAPAEGQSRDVVCP